ncbi:hypothetical protein CL176_00120 [Suicoccus acidiformans]|uniref:DUF1129 domain-containing protein n=1 Tax=Suicoccus acidiformans TaxID=2036206 RepID=A0A347WHK1_9LACT|nr:DUF1129 family protein [Suicoccus acidiformans]AXY24558.1 hypothetical protein CL176_00120 [Suicoccus acidiformans]
MSEKEQKLETQDVNEINETDQSAASDVVAEEIQEDIATDGVETVDLAEDAEAIDAFFDQAKAEASSPIAGINQATYNQLTKRNQQFLFDIDRYLIDEMPYEVRTKVYEEMVETLLAGQLSSQTARQIYGTPSEVAVTILEQEIKADEEAVTSPDWMIALDGSLFLGSVFTFLTGLSMMNAEEGQATYMGVLTIIVNYLFAGLAMLMISKVIPNPDAPKGERGYLRYFLVSILAMLVWFVAITASSVWLPASINPAFSGEVYMIIAAATFILRYYLKKRLNIQSDLF